MVSVEAFAPLYSDYLPALLTPVHGLFCPIGVLDVYGAIRLSVAVNWIASDTKGKPRASALQELFGIMVVLYGGETFIGEWSGGTGAAGRVHQRSKADNVRMLHWPAPQLAHQPQPRPRLWRYP